jgi:hypothetical protein
MGADNIWWRVFGFAIAIGGLVFFIYDAYGAIFHRGGRQRQRLYMTLASLYPVGVGFKVAVIGPEFVRFYLSDIDFSLSLGYVLFERFWHRSSQHRAELNRLHWTDQSLMILRYRRNALIAALFMSYAYETFVGVFYSLNKDISVQLIGSFDWWDMLMYTLGAGLGIVILDRWRRNIIVFKRQYEEEREAAFERARQVRRRTRPPKRRAGRGRKAR